MPHALLLSPSKPFFFLLSPATQTSTGNGNVIKNLLLAVEDGWVAVGPVEPSVGDLLVRRLGEVDAIPAEMRRRVRARVRPRHAAPRAVLVVELAAP